MTPDQTQALVARRTFPLYGGSVACGSHKGRGRCEMQEKKKDGIQLYNIFNEHKIICNFSLVLTRVISMSIHFI